MALPVQGEAYVFYVPLADRADPSLFVDDPTIVAGDFQVSIDGGALANLTTLPAAEPTGSNLVRVDLSAAEMGGAKINVVAIDAAGEEWEQVDITLDVPMFSIDTIGDLPVDGTTTLAESLAIINSGIAGKMSGAEINEPVFRDLADSKDRITAETDHFGNRLTVTTDGT